MSPQSASARAPAARILVIEQENPEREDMAQALSARGHLVETSADLHVLEHAARRGFNLLIVAQNNPTRNGPDLWSQLRRLRDHGGRMPVMVLLSQSHAADRAVALELGADAVLDKPYHLGELRARVQALLRRAGQDVTPPPQLVRFGQWQLDPDSRTLLTPTGLEVALSSAECALLQAFLEHPRSTLNRQQLLDLARGRGVQQLDRSIDLLVSRLRHKLEDDPRSPQLIHTVRGIGYLFQAAEPQNG
jgi:two-component system, OmpR family, response regulator